MDKEVISVIIPVYNVKKYLKKCLDSVLSQTYEALEIIIVNDGSTDGSDKICEEYARKDSRIVYISQANGGLSAARNAGMKKATGEYFAFVDSDDFIHKDFFNILHKVLCKNNADIAICKRLEIEEENIQKHTSDFENIFKEEVIDSDDNEYIISGKDAFFELYRDDSVDFIVAWNKLYRRKLLDKLEFPNGKIHEDEFAIPTLLYQTDKIVYKKMSLYFYIKRQGSIMLQEFNKKHLALEEALRKRIDFYVKNKITDCIGKGLHHYIGQSIYDMSRMGKDLSKEKRKLKFSILKYYLKYNKKDPRRRDDFYAIKDIFVK